MRILVTAPFAEEDLRELEHFGTIVYRPWKMNGYNRANEPEELLELLRETKSDALIVEHDKVTAELFEQVNLLCIGVCRGTPSNVDVAAATRKGIPVFHTPARNAQAVVEYVIGEVIMMLRKIRQSEEWLKGRNWAGSSHESYLQFRGSELAGKTIGLVGLGGVGKRLAGLLKHFSCRIYYYDPYVSETPNPAFIPVSLEQLFADSDIVSIHLPVNEETINMIDSRLFHLMKETAIFVNSARATVVNREALYETLKQKRIAGAILDVFYNEPPDEMDYEIINLPHVSATPHIAGNTFEVDRYHAQIMIRALQQWKRKERMEHLVNPEIYA